MIREFISLIILCGSVMLSVLGAVIYVNDRKNKAKFYYFLMCQFSAVAGIIELIYGWGAMERTLRDLAEVSLILTFTSCNLMAMAHCNIHTNKKLYSVGIIVTILSIAVSISIFTVFSPTYVRFFSKIGLDSENDRGIIISIFQYSFFVFINIYQYIMGRYVSDKAENQRQVTTYYYYLNTLFILTVLSFFLVLSMIVSGIEYIPFNITVAMSLVLSITIFILEKKFNSFQKSPKKFLKDIVNNMQDGIFLYDENFNIVYVNDSLTEMLDFSREEIVGMNVNSIFSREDDYKIFLEESYFEERKIIYDNPAKKIMPILLSVMSYREKDETLVGGVATIQDASFIVSKREETERRRESLKNEIWGAIKKKEEIEEKIEKGNIERDKISEKIYELTTKDSLTGLSNRNSISELLDGYIDDIETESIGVIVFDIDDFKPINDSRGHAFGDKLLIELGNRIKLVENEDIKMARLEEDEFLIIYKNFQSMDNIMDLCDKVKWYSEMTILIEGVSLKITISMGVALYPEHGETRDALLKNADSAMYFAKSEGKARYVFYNKAFREKAERDFVIMNELNYSLIQEEMFISFMPKVQFKGEKKKIASLETSLVWHNKRYGKMLQRSFIDLAVRNGFISELENFLFQRVEAFLSEARERGIPIPIVSVKLSEKSFFQEGFPEILYGIFKKDKEIINSIKLEISESTIMKDIELSIDILRRIKGYGFKIILTDFGLEHSSLIFLKDIDFDGVKIVEEFILEIGRSKKDEAIIKTIITLGKLLNIETIAEAVESEPRLNFLRENGLTTFQGLLVHPPVSEEKIWEFLEENM